MLCFNDRETGERKRRKEKLVHNFSSDHCLKKPDPRRRRRRKNLLMNKKMGRKRERGLDTGGSRMWTDRSRAYGMVEPETSALCD
jgi:hypothetical protein